MKNDTWSTGRFNPYLPFDVCIPDGEPKCFDGRAYIYGSKDELDSDWCSHRYHTYSAPLTDLTQWTDHGPILASTNEYISEGIEDTIPWSNGLLWAPDVICRDSIYYLYFCLSDGSEGVAESPYPYGPFLNSRQITMNGKPIEGIDPSVLCDNGVYYYTWGQGNCHMAELEDDMCTLKPETYVEALISHEDGCHGFHEGSSLRKVGDWFCIVYASEYTEAWPNRRGTPCKLDYAYSKNILGPYTRGGTIIDNTGVDPATWNNHGSIIKLGDQWYVFYHGSSNNTQYARHARVERIEVDEATCTIRQAVMTSSGFAEALDPSEEIPAYVSSGVFGGAYFTKEAPYPLVSITDGCSAAYNAFDFGAEAQDLTLRLQGSFTAGTQIEVQLSGETVGIIRCEDPAVKKPLFGAALRITSEEILSLPLTGLTGRKELKLIFRGKGKALGELFSLRFV